MAFKELSAPNLTFEEIENLAAENKIAPKNMSLEDQSAYLALLNLYSLWQSGHIERERAKKEKNKIKNARKKQKEVFKLYADACAYMQENIRHSEGIRNNLLRDLRVGKDILADALECIGRMRNDTAFIANAQEILKEKQNQSERKEYQTSVINGQTTLIQEDHFKKVKKMAQTKYKMPLHIRRAIIWLCRGYDEALDWQEQQSKSDLDTEHYNFRLVKAVDNALYNVGSDLENIELRNKLRQAIWENTLNGRIYPYEVWNLPTIYRDNFYERKRKFIKEVAVNMGIIQQDE